MPRRFAVALALNVAAAAVVLYQLPVEPVTAITSSAGQRRVQVLTQPWLVDLTGVLLTTAVFLVAAVAVWRRKLKQAASLSALAAAASLYFASALQFGLELLGLHIAFNVAMVGVVAALWTAALCWRSQLLTRPEPPLPSAP